MISGKCRGTPSALVNRSIEPIDAGSEFLIRCYSRCSPYLALFEARSFVVLSLAKARSSAGLCPVAHRLPVTPRWKSARLISFRFPPLYVRMNFSAVIRLPLVLPLLILVISSLQLAAYPFGAEPGVSGAPGDGTCMNCHGTSLNSGSGSATFLFPDGATTYLPGQKMRILLRVSDPRARAWGFEASVRRASAPATTGAGTLASVDDDTQVLRNAATVQWITHTTAGSHPGVTGSYTYEFDWTAPSTAVGDVVFYASANAANGNGRADSGDAVYATSARLMSAVPVSGNPPAISVNGVVNAFSGKLNNYGPGTWVTVYGTDLAPVTRAWTSADFANNTGPYSLEGVTATVNGKAAVLNYVSPAQVNLQIPIDSGNGSSTLVLTTPAGSSPSYPLTLTRYAPALLAPAAFSVGGQQYAVAQFADGAYVGRPGLVPGLSFRPAKAGDMIVLYGVGFGPLAAQYPTGWIIPVQDPTFSAVTFKIGSATVTPVYAGAAPGLVGAYQFNLLIPGSTGTGDVSLEATVGGVSTSQGLVLTVE